MGHAKLNPVQILFFIDRTLTCTLTCPILKGAFMIQLFTDTSANLPMALIKQYGLTVLPFSYTLNGVEQPYNPTADFDGAAFYTALQNGAKVKTSMINTAAFLEAMRPALQKGNDVLYIGMSGGISGTAFAAATAVAELKEEFPHRKISAIDTFAASLGEGLLVLKAAKMLQEEADFEAVESKILTLRHKQCQFFVVDDLEHLRRGGRINRAVAVLGSVLQIKPILTGDAEGKIVQTGKARGQRQSLEALANRFKTLCADPTKTVGIAHANNPQGAAMLTKLLMDCGLKGECLTVCYEPVTGAHVGPGTVALFFEGVQKQ